MTKGPFFIQKLNLSLKNKKKTALLPYFFVLTQTNSIEQTQFN